MRFAGELAAVGTAVCWGSSSSLFTISGRRMGSLVLNRLRLTVALFLLAGTLCGARVAMALVGDPPRGATLRGQ